MAGRCQIALVGSLLATMVLAGCGNRPAEEDLSEALQDGVSITVFGGVTRIKYDEKQADCVAEVLHDSEISDQTLAQIAKPAKGNKASAEDLKALAGSAKKLQACDPESPNPLVLRPTASDLADGFDSGLRGYPFGSKVLAKTEGEEGLCLGKQLEGSAISNLTLVKLLKQDKDYRASEADLEAFKKISDQLNICVKPELGGETPTP